SDGTSTDDTRLLMSKGRIESRKKTIPQLELIAALLVAETLVVVRKVLPHPPARIYLFTDSSVTLHRIHSDPNHHEAFVANRLRRIHQLTEPKDWYHLSGKYNPADLV